MSGAGARARLNRAIRGLHRFTSSRRVDAVHAERSGVALTLAAVAVLGRVIEHGPVRPTDVARHVGMTMPGVSRQLRLLEATGLVVRRPDAADGRAALVTVTPAGRDAHRRVMDANDELLAAQLAGWSDEDVEHAADVIERLTRALRGG